jgi:thioredoxin reductase (NADPH)
MARPAIFAVDDDPEVLRAIERDLRREYGREYRVLRADSGDAALTALRELKVRGDPVALLLVDQRMPRVSGVEFLVQAREVFPDAKRVLLTAYADTEAAISAINDVDLDYYLMKPWDPPEERLYPLLTDLLSDWQAGYRPPFQGVRVIGHQWSPTSHEVKDFLARNQAPYQWLDFDSSEEGRRLVLSAAADPKRLPLVLLPDGGLLVEPSPTELAAGLGLRTRAEKPFYDLIIVGAGPAGLAAAVYGGSEGLRTLLVEREAPGGQAGTSSRIENYLGFPSGISGADLARRAVDQTRKFEVELLMVDQVCAVRAQDPQRIVELAGGSEILCHALIIATGVSWRRLHAPGVEELTGAGVYYGAAMTEGSYCRDEDIFIVGGANSAGQAAMYFSKVARTVTLLVRGDSLEKGMSQYLVDEIRRTPNIRAWLRASVEEAHGDGRLEAITVRATAPGGSGETCETLPAAALFIMIGAEPRTEWLDGFVARDRRGFVLTGPDLAPGSARPRGWMLDRDPYLLETSVPGVFAVGDVRHGSVKRVASAVGEGSVAVQFVHQHLAEV